MRKFRALFSVSIRKITQFAALTYNFIISTVRMKAISFKGPELLKIKIMVRYVLPLQSKSQSLIILDVCWPAI
jgi:hypothetical protein